MKRISTNTKQNSARYMIEWLLLIALAMLLCFASCKKDAETDEADTTVKVETEVEAEGGDGDEADAGGGEAAEGEAGAEGETAGEGEGAAEGESAEGEGADTGSDTDSDAGSSDGASGDGSTGGGEAGSGEGSDAGGGESGSEGTAAVDASIDPEKVYIDNGCTMCHKVDRSGGTLGPDIRNIAEYWNPDSLTAYLKNPSQNISKHPRLVEMEKEGKYLAEMPPLREQDESRIKALVDWLLTPAE